MGCGYSLTGLVEWRCPECGERFDPRETWLNNERSTWEYHFENVRPRSEYFAWGVLGLLVLSYLLSCTGSRLVLLALPLVAAGEVAILWVGAGGLRTRLICWTVAVLWCLFILMLV